MSKKEMKYLMILDLQMFDGDGGGGDGGTGSEGGTGVPAGVPGLQSKNSVKNPLANVKYGIQEGQQNAPAVNTNQSPEDARLAEFEKLIKGEYKDLYDQRMQDTIQKRLKNTKETVDKYNALSPTLEMLSRKYGVDASDIEALNKAIEEDDSYYEDEALEKGITVQQLKEIKKMERENTELKRQMREADQRQQADRIYAQWMQEAEALTKVYPSFDLNTELQNDRFVDLLRSNVDVRTAFEVLHKDEIIPAAMQFTANQVEQKLVNKMMARGSRPTENGINSQAASLVKSDVSQLSKADRQEIIRRVARGERIRF